MQEDREMARTSQPDQLRERFEQVNGYWSAGWAKVLERDPGFFSVCLELMAAPGKLNFLDGVTRELIHIAINVACNRESEAATRTHVRRAIAEGASREAIAEAIQLTSVIGIHSCVIGVPMLLDLAAAAGLPPEPEASADGARLEALKRAFIEKRGYWSPLWDGLLSRSPDFFEAYTAFSAMPWDRGELSPKTKELIYIAIDISTNHLFEPGTEIHIKNALGYGASIEEVLEVIETVSLLSLESVPMGYAILDEEWSKDS